MLLLTVDDSAEAQGALEGFAVTLEQAYLGLPCSGKIHYTTMVNRPMVPSMGLVMSHPPSCTLFPGPLGSENMVISKPV